MPSEDRRVGKLLPTPVTPVSTICYRIEIPDAVPYRAAFLGQLDVLGQANTWDHPRDGTECPDCETAAQLWRNALYLASWTEECEETLSCEEIISCIETNVDTRQAVVDALLSSPDMRNYITNIINQSGGIVPNQNNQNLLKPDLCDYGAIFAQASTVIQLLHDLTEDIFEAVEVGTNAVERAELLINILGGGTRAMIVDTILEWADTMVENLTEEYAGAYDTALYDVLRCELFCRVNDSCTMTIDDIHAYYSEKFGQSLPGDIFEALNAIANFQITGDFPGDTVVYSMHLMIINLIKAGDDVLGINFSRLGLRVIAASATPDPTWETLCEDCTEIPNLRLEVYPGWPEETLEFVSNVDDDTSIYRIRRTYTGHYATGAWRSVGLLPFYVRATEVESGPYWNDVGTGAGNLFAGGRYPLNEIPCWLAGTTFTTEGGGTTEGGEWAEITVSRIPCQEIWLRPRVDGDWGAATFTITHVGFDSLGRVIYDVTNSSASGHPRVGFDTVDETLTTLKSAYLVSATPPVGETITNHYHEQADQIGSGTGANGTTSSKKWAFFGMTGLNKTIRVVLSHLPY